jgi:hypothetical protein
LLLIGEREREQACAVRFAERVKVKYFSADEAAV